MVVPFPFTEKYLDELVSGVLPIQPGDEIHHILKKQPSDVLEILKFKVPPEKCPYEH
jgi:hypothetical protein